MPFSERRVEWRTSAESTDRMSASMDGKSGFMKVRVRWMESMRVLC